MPVQAPRRLFAVDEFHQMAKAGIFDEDDRVELLDGEIVQMSPVGSQHAAAVGRLNRLLQQRLGVQCIVRIQDPIRLDDYSEPQPDLAVVKARDDFYSSAHPVPADVLLLVEVADISLETDRSDKIPLYARAGIAEVWIVDVDGRAIETYSRPQPAGYQQRQRFASGDRLPSVVLPARTASVAEILG